MGHQVVHGDLNEVLVLFLEQPLAVVQVPVLVKVDSVVELELIQIIRAVVLVVVIPVVLLHIMAQILKAAEADRLIAVQIK